MEGKICYIDIVNLIGNLGGKELRQDYIAHRLIEEITGLCASMEMIALRNIAIFEVIS